MTPFLRRVARAAVACGALLPVAMAGQGDRISLRFRPSPERVLHFRSTTEMTFVVEADDRPPVRFESKVVSALTSMFGRADESGRFDGEAVIEEMTTATKIDGTEVPAPPVQVPVIGRRFGATYDASGTVVDLRLPDDMRDAEPILRQLLSGVNKSFPVTEAIGVGERVTRPLDFAFPVPDKTAAATLKLAMTLTLRRIDDEVPDRIAHFDVSIGGSAMGAGIPLTIDGGGTLEWNVDQGFARANRIEYNMTLSPAAGSARGTIRIASTTTY